MRTRWRLRASVMLWDGDDDDLFAAIWPLRGINVEHVVSCGGVQFQTVEEMVQFLLRLDGNPIAHSDELSLRVFLLTPDPQTELDLSLIRDLVEEMMPGRATVHPVTYARTWLADEDTAQSLAVALARVASRRGFQPEVALDRSGQPDEFLTGGQQTKPGTTGTTVSTTTLSPS